MWDAERAFLGSFGPGEAGSASSFASSPILGSRGSLAPMFSKSSSFASPAGGGGSFGASNSGSTFGGNSGGGAFGGNSGGGAFGANSGSAAGNTFGGNSTGGGSAFGGNSGGGAFGGNTGGSTFGGGGNAGGSAFGGGGSAGGSAFGGGGSTGGNAFGGGNTGGNAFGGNASGGGAFGNSGGTTFGGGSTGAGAFGGNSASGGGAFGASNTGGSAFGANNTGGSAFGSSFGTNNNNNKNNNSSGGAFGGGGSSMFGSSFNNNSSGNNNNNKGGLFGGGSTGGSSLFGGNQSSSAFGGSAFGGGNSMFGGNNNNSNSGGLFNANNNNNNNNNAQWNAAQNQQLILQQNVAYTAESEIQKALHELDLAYRVETQVAPPPQQSAWGAAAAAAPQAAPNGFCRFKFVFYDQYPDVAQRQHVAAAAAALDAQNQKVHRDLNPDENLYAPVVCMGVDQLRNRGRRQQQEVGRWKENVEKMRGVLRETITEPALTRIEARLEKQRRTNSELRTRILQVLLKVELLRGLHRPAQGEEVLAKKRLHALRHGGGENVEAVAQRLQDVAAKASQTDGRVDKMVPLNDGEAQQLAATLRRQKEGLGHLLDILQKDKRDMLIMANSSDSALNAPNNGAFDGGKVLYGL